MRKLVLMILGLALATAAHAGVVSLTDGSSLSGELKEQANGDVIVVTGAGEITVAKDKIKSIVKDGSASSAKPEGDMTYVNKVLARREKYGNEDGIPRSANLQQRQIAFTIGQLSYVGDALAFGPSGSATDFNSIYYGLSLANSFNDVSGWELWGGYGIGEKDYGSAIGKVSVQRSDISFMPRLQKAINLGQAESPVMLIPHVGIGPVYSYVSTMAPGAFRGGSAVGGALSAGLDFQFGSALVGFKYRYLLSQDTSGSLNSRNLSASLLQASAGWAF